MKAFKYIAVFLFIGLLSVPSAIEFAHIFMGHQHEVCTDYSDTHFHGKNIDCELFSFQKVTFTYPQFLSYTLFTPEIRVLESQENYLFLNTILIHAFKQRGPPEVAA